MSRSVPFTAHIKIFPVRGKRMEHVRSIQKIAIMAYNGLLDEASIQVASPGGGQACSYGDSGGIGWGNYGCAVKPQIGVSPAQLQITGFYLATADNVQPYSSSQLISAGSVYDSTVESHTWTDQPISTIDNEVVDLKSKLVNALTGSLPDNTDFSIFRIDYSGIVFGDKGYHFPL